MEEVEMLIFRQEGQFLICTSCEKRFDVLADSTTNEDIVAHGKEHKAIRLGLECNFN